MAKDLLERLRECVNIIKVDITELTNLGDATDQYKNGERRGQVLAYEKVLRVLYSRISELSNKD